jgi:hypothetical protein
MSLALPGALLCNKTHRLGDGKHVILLQRVLRSARAVRAIQNTRVFLRETTVVADVPLRQSSCAEHLSIAARLCLNSASES